MDNTRRKRKPALEEEAAFNCFVFVICAVFVCPAEEAVVFD